MSPQTMSKSRMPRDQTVASTPLYLWCSIHSGGEYTRVPVIHHCFFYWICSFHHFHFHFLKLISRVLAIIQIVQISEKEWKIRKNSKGFERSVGLSPAPPSLPVVFFPAIFSTCSLSLILTARVRVQSEGGKRVQTQNQHKSDSLRGWHESPPVGREREKRIEKWRGGRGRKEGHKARIGCAPKMPYDLDGWMNGWMRIWGSTKEKHIWLTTYCQSFTQMLRTISINMSKQTEAKRQNVTVS